MARVNEESHRFACQPHVYPQVGLAILFYSSAAAGTHFLSY